MAQVRQVEQKLHAHNLRQIKRDQKGRISTDTKLRSSVYEKKLKSSGTFAPRTLTSFGFALTHWTDARRWTLSALRSGLDVSSMVKRWTLTSLRSGLDISNLVNPHFVRVRAICLNLRSMRIVRARLFVRAQASSPGAIFCECPVRARSFERAHPLAGLHARTMILLFKNGAAAAAQQVLGGRRWRRALGRARLRARPNLTGCGEVTSPLFSINSILNANWYQIKSGRSDPIELSLTK